MDAAPTGKRSLSQSGTILLVVSMANFTDEYIYSSVVPILPFLLKDRVGIKDSQLQKCRLPIGCYHHSLLTLNPRDICFDCCVCGSYSAWLTYDYALYNSDCFWNLTDNLLLFLALIGWISDRPGLRRTVYIGGLLLTALSTLAFAAGRTIWILIVGRILQSLSSSVVRCTGMAMLKDSTPINRQGRTMGCIAIPQSLGMLAGPIVSGWMYEKVSYSSVWIVIGAILLLDIIARLFASDAGDTSQEISSNSPVSIVQYPEDSRNDNERQHERTLLLRRDQEITSLRGLLITYFLDQRVLLGLWLCFVQAYLQGSLTSTLPLFLSNVFNANSAETSIIFLALSMPLTLAVFIGMLFDQYDAYIITATGLAIGAPSFVCLRYVTHEAPSQVALLVVLTFLCGSTIILIGVPSMAVCSTVASELVKATTIHGSSVNISGQVFSTIRIVRASGETLGPAIAAIIVSRIGWTSLTAMLGAICAASFIAVSLCSLKKIFCTQLPWLFG